ncbi:hypothetical protein WCLP8_4710002 [uncultured Gammaproteobacteria bacterium]
MASVTPLAPKIAIATAPDKAVRDLSPLRDRWQAPLFIAIGQALTGLGRGRREGWRVWAVMAQHLGGGLKNHADLDPWRRQCCVEMA